MTDHSIVPAAETAEPTPPTAKHGSRGLLLRAVAGLLSVVLLGLVVVALIEVKRAHTVTQKEAASQAALTAGITDFPLVASYSYATIDADMKRAKSVFAPALQKDYDTLFKPLLQTLQQNKVIVTTQVQQGQAIAADSPTSVRLLIFYTQQTSEPSSASPHLAAGSEAVTMTKLNGKWLIGAANAAG